MLPYQQPPQEGKMPLAERIEWAVMIVGILLWWPKVFLGGDHPLHDSPVYNTVIYLVVPLALLAVFIRRLRRFLEAMRQQEEEHDRRHPPKSRM